MKRINDNTIKIEKNTLYIIHDRMLRADNLSLSALIQFRVYPVMLIAMHLQSGGETPALPVKIHRTNPSLMKRPMS